MPTPKLSPGEPGEREVLRFLLECGGVGCADEEARRLLDEYGGLYEAAKAVSAGNYGDRARALTLLAMRTGRRMAEETKKAEPREDGDASARPRIVKGRRLPDSEFIGEALMDMYDSEVVEQIMVICCDKNDRVTGKYFVSTGDERNVRANIKGIVEAVLDDEVKGVILAHNHPDSAALPSDADLTATNMLSWLLLCLGKELLDHIVVYSDDYVSMYESGMLGRSESAELWRTFRLSGGRLVRDGEEL